MDKQFTEQERTIETLRKFYKSDHDLFERTGYWINGVFFPNIAAVDFSSEWKKRTKPLRNVVPRAVDFFSLKMLPGKISIITDKDPLKMAVNQILKWSNFDEKKKLYLTDLALTGDLFLRVGIISDKIYFQYIPPEDVTALDEDWRGYLQNIRIDYEVDGDNGILLTHTEFWNKEYFAIWEHTLAKNTPIEDLGTPILYGMLSSFGLNFCPVVHIKFRDIGREDFRGIGCVNQSLPVIEEACREATAMAKAAFRDKQTWVLAANSIDANNFTLDPIKVIKQVSVIEAVPGQSQQNVTPDDIWQAPAMSTITSLLEGINWQGLQAIIDSTMEELNQEIPALRYWTMKDQTNFATKTVQLLLDAAISQARESARSFVSGLVRVCQIGLTMGIYQGLFSSTLGNYANGDFDFDITAGQAFEPSMDDMSLTLTNLKTAGIPLAAAMKLVGFSQEQIDEADQLDQAAQTAKIDQLKQALVGINEANAITK